MTRIVLIILLLTSTRVRAGSDRAVALEVFVWLEDNSEPGVPVLLVARDASGAVLLRAKTDSHGKALLTLTPSSREAAVRVEALIDIGAGREYGAVQSLSPRQTRLCIHMPRFPLLHCQD